VGTHREKAWKHKGDENYWGCTKKEREWEDGKKTLGIKSVKAPGQRNQSRGTNEKIWVRDTNIERAKTPKKSLGRCYRR